MRGYKNLKVLFVSSLLAFQNVGGGEIQMLKTKKYLEELFKLKIDIFDIVNTKIADYDLIHFFGSEYTLYPIVRAAKSLDKKIVVSSIFYDNRPSILYKLSIWMSKKIPVRTSVLDRAELLKLADYILPNSQIEADYIEKAFGISKEKLKVIPNGIDVEEISEILSSITEKDEKDFLREYKINFPYILYVGRFDHRKNQLSLIRAFKKVLQKINRINLVLIGSPNIDEIEYYNRCKEEALDCGDKILFIPAIKHSDKKLWIAYKKAEVHVMPSLFETPGLVSLEAGFCGCRLIVSLKGGTKEYFEDYVLYVDPTDIDDIANKLIMALEDNSRDLKNRIAILQEKIVNIYNWKNAAEKTYEVYKELLNV